VKGVIGFAFPTVATPLLALVTDVRTAVAVLIVPNIVMDGIQLVRRGNWLATARRHAVLLAFGAVGMALGTHLLVALPPWVATLILGCFLLAFVALNLTRVPSRVPPAWETRLAPVAGLVAGVVGGLTNVPGTPLVIFFHALGMPKDDFVRSVAFTFGVFKVVQLAAVAFYGLLSLRLLAISVALTAVALLSFGLGLRVQERLDQQTFNRVLLVALAVLGAWLVARALG
jgi:uncharacterized membrane protein YfcA